MFALLCSAPQRICGWCLVELAPGTLPASHGICARRYVALDLQEKRRAGGVR